MSLAYSGLGRYEEAINTCREALRADNMSNDVLQTANILIHLAMAYTSLGMEDKSIDLLEDLLSRPSVLTAGYLKIDPVWDPLRDNPRFIKLMESQEH